MPEFVPPAESPACPVCAGPLARPAYAPDSGRPSFDFCPTCDIQFGWDDKVPPDAPAGERETRWREWRELWLRERAGAEETERCRRQFSD